MTLTYDGADRHVGQSQGEVSIVYQRDGLDRVVARSVTEPGVVSHRASSQGSNGSGATTLAVSRPTGTQAGDVLVAQVVVKGTVTITAPAGWTQIGSPVDGTGVRVATYWRVAATGDPTSWTFTLASKAQAAGGITAYTGVDPVYPVDVTATRIGAASTTHTLESVTPSGVNRMLVTIGLAGGGSFVAPTTPVGYGERRDVASTGTSSGRGDRDTGRSPRRCRGPTLPARWRFVPHWSPPRSGTVIPMVQTRRCSP
jgi:hypothetical protein